MKSIDFKLFLPLLFTVLALGLTSSFQEAYAGDNGPPPPPTTCSESTPGTFTLEDGNTEVDIDPCDLDDMDWETEDNSHRRHLSGQELFICELVDVSEDEGFQPGCPDGPVVFDIDNFVVIEAFTTNEASLEVEYDAGVIDAIITVTWEVIGGAFGSFESTLEETIEIESTNEGQSFRFFQETNFDLAEGSTNTSVEISPTLAVQTELSPSSGSQPITATVSVSPAADEVMAAEFDDVVEAITSVGELDGTTGPLGTDENWVFGFSWDIFDLGTGDVFTIEKTKQLAPILAEPLFSNDVLYSCSVFDSDPQLLRQINPNTAETIKEIPLIPPEGFELDNRCTALATGPGNQLFGAFRMFEVSSEVTAQNHGSAASDRFLVSINPNSGVMTNIGLFDINGIAGLAFASGELFAVSGEGGDPSETLFTVDTSDASLTEVCELGNGSNGEEIAFSTADNRIYHFSGFTTFESITGMSDGCSVEDHGVTEPLDDNQVTSMTYWQANDIFIVANFEELYQVTRPQSPGESTYVGEMDHDSGGLAFVKGKSGGGTGHEPPTIGKSLDGVRQVVDCGIAIDGDCSTVTSGYHEEMELLQMLTSPHTISNTIYCDKGVEYCNYIAVGFMGLTDDFNNPLMTVSASKDHVGTWTLGWFDPNDFISDPGDAVAGDIVFVPQIIDNKLLGTSFTIDFKNKDTGQLKLGIQVRDSYNGVRNFYFNEGVEFIDADAYPAVNAAYDEPIEVEPLCFGQNNVDRNSCAFAKIKDWATANAEDALRQMMNDQYEQ